MSPETKSVRLEWRHGSEGHHRNLLHAKNPYVRSVVYAIENRGSVIPSNLYQVEVCTTHLYGLQICVGCWVSKDSEHRDDLALVVKCMRDDVQQDKGRTPEFTAPICGTLRDGDVKLLFRQTRHISSCRLSYSVFRSSQRGHRWAIFCAPTREGFVLQIVDPAFLTRQDVHQLLPN